MTWSRDKIIRAIQEWAAEHEGRPPTANDWKGAAFRELATDRYPSMHVATRAFGSWSAAVRAAGFNPYRSHRRRNPEDFIVCATCGIHMERESESGSCGFCIHEAASPPPDLAAHPLFS